MTLALVAAVLFLCWVWTRWLDAYREIILDKYRFRFFAMRDELALMVTSGALSEQTWEYQSIVDAINHNIRTIEDVSHEQRLSMILADLVRPDGQRQVKKFSRQVTDERVKAVLYDYFVTTRSLIIRSGRLLPWRSTWALSLAKLYTFTMNRLHNKGNQFDVDELSLQTSSFVERLEKEIDSLI